MYGLVVRLIGAEPGTLLAAGSSRLFNPLPSFQDYLRFFDPRTLYTAATALDCYAAVKSREDGVVPRPPQYPPLPFVDEVLWESGGILLWHHQLERLYALFSGDEEGATGFRKGIQQRRADTYERARRLRLAGVTLTEVIEEREWLGYLQRRPSLHAAARLLRYLGRA